ncbi:MAG TPA: S66 peptidase family protein [Trebonia sp.]|nr:S66 peptidase family protein [Trebonia sp.]
MPPAFTYPAKPVAGDQVAVISPSAGLPGILPLPFDLGLRRLREEFGLVPVEYPTTRVMGASPAGRAADIHAAFADPAIKAVITSIGGEDELTVLPHLDPELLAANPKPFFGYSDNTNLHVYLWSLGIVSFYGGAVMTQFGRPGEMHPVSKRALTRALFTPGAYVLEEPASYCDQDKDWADPATFAAEPESFPAPPWSWHGPAVSVTGPAWGGCLEIMDFHLRTARYMPPDTAFDGCVLFFETSEELWSDTYVYRVLMCMGERGLLRRFGAILWARPKAWSLDDRKPPAAKERYVAAQRDAVLRAAGEYAPEVPLVFGVDFGHTEPQHIIPNGGMVTVDGAARRIEVTY